jgi:high frequency lysogenization protein
MTASARNQAMAMAGLMHCTWLVRQLAHQGQVRDSQLVCALSPVFRLEPESVEAVYGDAACRHSALTVLKAQLGSAGVERDVETTRYAATLLHLERKLARRKDLMEQLRSGLEEAARQLEHFGTTHHNTIARLADLYSRTVSTLRPKVMVQGESRFLEQPDTANLVRALLLAGMRSAVLWRQCGGSRLGLILGRGRLLKAAAELDAA